MKIPRLNDSYIRRKCGLTALTVRETTSTNTIMKEYAFQGAPEGCALIAESQTAGRGRLDHTFFSPLGTGLYMSVLLRPQNGDFIPGDITAAAGVAACEAIEKVSDRSASIKWVNDVYCGGKKVCGILCESGFFGSEHFVVVGAGFNVFPPENGFPAGIASRADSIFRERKVRYAREELAIAFYQRLMKRYKTPATVYSAYRDRMFLFGRKVYFENMAGTVTGLDREYRLELTLEDGQKKLLSAGEVSLHLTPLTASDDNRTER